MHWILTSPNKLHFSLVRLHHMMYFLSHPPVFVPGESHVSVGKQMISLAILWACLRRAQQFVLGVKNSVQCLQQWDSQHKWAGAPIQLTPCLPIPVRSRADSHGMLYLSLLLSTHAQLQYRINATFHLVTLTCHRLDWCSIEIGLAFQIRVPGVKISNAVGLLFCHSFNIN